VTEVRDSSSLVEIDPKALNNFNAGVRSLFDKAQSRGDNMKLCPISTKQAKRNESIEHLEPNLDVDRQSHQAYKKSVCKVQSYYNYKAIHI